jgi:hypothetical protein
MTMAAAKQASPPVDRATTLQANASVQANAPVQADPSLRLTIPSGAILPDRVASASDMR